MPGKKQAPPPYDPNDPVAEFLFALSELLNGAEDMAPGQIKSALDEVLARRPAPPLEEGLSAVRQARELVERAWDSEGDGAAMALDALRLDPNCAEAYVLLGTDAGGESDLAFVLFSLGIVAGTDALSDRFFQEHAGDFFTFLEARPLLRAMEGAGLAAMAGGAVEQAVSFFDSVLQLDRGDHLGVRYHVLAIAMAHDDRQLAEALFAEYPADDDAVWTYWEALHAFRGHGDCPAARKALGRALDLNPHLPAYLLGRKPPSDPDSEPTPGSEEEAAVMSWEMIQVWRQAPDASAWLASGEEAARSGRRQWFIGLE